MARLYSYGGLTSQALHTTVGVPAGSLLGGDGLIVQPIFIDLPRTPDACAPLAFGPDGEAALNCLTDASVELDVPADPAVVLDLGDTVEVVLEVGLDAEVELDIEECDS